jgi:hypothetical protein
VTRDLSYRAPDVLGGTMIDGGETIVPTLPDPDEADSDPQPP